MPRAPKSEAEKFAELARSEIHTDRLFRQAVLKMVRKDPEFGRRLILEVLDVKGQPERFVRLGETPDWLDMAGISALAVIERITDEIRMGDRERKEDQFGPVRPELIRQEMEDVPPGGVELVRQILDQSQRASSLLEESKEALEHLALLLS